MRGRTKPRRERRRRRSKQRGGKALARLAEVSDEAQVKRMVDAAVARFGRIDVLVNNAAMRRETPIDKITLDEWHAVLRA